jgi:hypothetical protein
VYFIISGGGSTPSASLDYESNTSLYWVSPDTMKKGISDFFKEASQATGWGDGKGGYYWNQDHKTIERRYNNNTDN